MSEHETILEYINEGGWLEPAHDSIETNGGDDVYALTVSPTGVTVNTHEKFGDGQTPYSRTPDHHIEQLNRPTVTTTEGTVVYPTDATADDEQLRLPKLIYHEYTIDFDSPINSVSDLETALETAIGWCPDISEIQTLARENGDL